MALPVSRIVNVNLNLSPLAAGVRSFGVLMIAGDSNVINGSERFRSYEDIDGVAADFGTTAPEYKAAALYFGQTPAPSQLMIGRWLRTATSGMNIGGILTSAQQLASAWTSITNGGVVIHIDGVTKTLTGLDFSLITNMNGVADVINGDLTGGLVSFVNGSFIVTSSTTGVSSTVTAATAGSGTDISAQLKLTAGTLIEIVPGYAPETPVAAVAILANESTSWYGLCFACATEPTDDQSIDVSTFIEATGATVSRIYGVTVVDPNVLSAQVTSDLASRQMAGQYLRSFCQYSENAFAIASLFGRAFSVDFTANNSTITLMFKQEPSVVPEDLTSTQADVLKSKRCNVFVAYVNDTNIIQYGVMSGPAFIDDIQDLDWFTNDIQTSVYNVLYTSPTKIPQTDAGANQLGAAVGGSCDRAVNNGTLAPGVWNGPAVGQITTGQYLKAGYYIYVQPLILQSQGDREARKAPPIIVAAKLAGAIQEVNITVDVNR